MGRPLNVLGLSEVPKVDMDRSREEEEEGRTETWEGD